MTPNCDAAKNDLPRAASSVEEAETGPGGVGPGFLAGQGPACLLAEAARLLAA